MIQSSRLSDAEWQQRLDKMLAALVRARNRAKEIARQTGTLLVYERDGKIIRENPADKSVE